MSMGSSSAYEGGSPESAPIAADPATQPAGGTDAATQADAVAADAPAETSQDVQAQTAGPAGSSDQPVENVSLALPSSLLQSLRAEADKVGKDFLTWLHEELHKLAGGGSTPT